MVALVGYAQGDQMQRGESILWWSFCIFIIAIATWWYSSDTLNRMFDMDRFYQLYITLMSIKVYVHFEWTYYAVWQLFLDSKNVLICRIGRKISVMTSFIAKLDTCIWGEKLSVEKMPATRLVCFQAVSAFSWLMCWSTITWKCKIK